MKRKTRITKKTTTSPIVQACVPPTRAQVYRAARAYRRAGLSVIPVKTDGTKAPAIKSWKGYQERRPTLDELQDWFDPDRVLTAQGIAVLGGAVSGGLEILDIDCWKYVEPWKELVRRSAPGLLKRLVMVRTPRPGLHVYFRCREIGGNQKLAQVPVINKKTGKRGPKVIIETRGEGGYVLAPPSPAACHPTGRCYRVLDGKDLTTIPTITPDERSVLLDAARALNRWLDARPDRHVDRDPQHVGPPQSGRPGDDFNARGDWGEILSPHGWSRLFVGNDGTEYWRRPGKHVGGPSATVNHGGAGLLYVFSSNADPFEPERAYTKFHAHALLNHDGDFEAAAQELAAQGYGRRHFRRGRARKRLNPAFAHYATYSIPEAP